ncbi:MAG: flavin reductase [Defluviitaleaceae bacterium]|nr:flavin reductase [Defluviitaleaceae bacterium]MCL2837144.1 flavin reductase [Defluviitaleaceae bacterium]
MKKEFSAKPEIMKEVWPGEFKSFSWKELMTAIPTAMFLVTGWKSNGKENACLQQYSTFVTDSGEFICIMGWVSKNGHMYKSLKETGCCVLNFPSGDLNDQCIKTVENNQYETDEITASGLTAEKAAAVNAPRIAECFLNIECEYLWEQQNFEHSSRVVVALKAVHICMDSERYDQGKLGRYGETGYMYNIYNARNPDTDKAESDGYFTLTPQKPV